MRTREAGWPHRVMGQSGVIGKPPGR
jgi:hypothetical protein